MGLQQFKVRYRRAKGAVKHREFKPLIFTAEDVEQARREAKQVIEQDTGGEFAIVAITVLTLMSTLVGVLHSPWCTKLLHTVR